MISYRRSAFKHGYTAEDIERAIHGPVVAAPIFADSGASGWSVLGFASNADLINVRYHGDLATGGPVVVFHAQKALRGTRRRML